MIKKWQKLRDGNILGVVDSYGAVHSVLTEDVEFHSDYYPATYFCRWRWDFDKGLWWISKETKPDEEQQDAIRRHLNKKYGIKWWDNGFHDIDFILTKCGEVQDEYGQWINVDIEKS